MTRTKKNPATLEEVNRGRSKVLQAQCTLRRINFQQYIYELQNQGWIEPALIILLLIGGLK